MYCSEKLTEDSERTAFRRAEKKYKLYYDNSSKKEKQPKPVDLSEVLDFRTILKCHKLDGELPSGVTLLEEKFSCPVFCLENRPGFYFLPGALSVEEQCTLIRESLTDFPQPPNRTNRNAIYGPIHESFNSAKEEKVLAEDNSPISSSESNPDIIGRVGKECKFSLENVESAKQCKSVSASALLGKLRWSTLGLQFDWSKRKALIKDLASAYHTECLSYCQELLELKKKAKRSAMTGVKGLKVINLQQQRLDIFLHSPQESEVKGKPRMGTTGRK